MKIKKQIYSKPVFIVIFGLTGLVLLVSSLASTFTASIEAENEQLSNGASVGSDSAASGGKYVELSSSTTSGSCESQPVGGELLSNPGFEGSYSGLAPGWSENHWDGATFSAARVTSNVHSGSSAQRLSVNNINPGGALFYSPYNFVAGKTYEGSVWLRSDNPISIQFIFRQTDAHYESVATKWIDVTTQWKKYTIMGGWDVNLEGRFAISFKQSGTVYIDDASFREMTQSSCIDNSGSIPGRHFGMHINKWGTYNTWPTATKFGLLRLWDTATRWQDLEPTNNSWEWFRMDYYVNAAVGANQEIIYTLGQTPNWASDCQNCGIYGGAGAPTNIEYWRDYVRTVGNRYKGKIKYYEIWNETDYDGFYQGSMSKMLQMTQVASQELKAIDPEIKILSPNITVIGLTWLDEFLARGGGNYVDIISWHYYGHLTPEHGEPLVHGVKDMMKAHQQDHKPLWNTEGSPEGTVSATGQDTGAVARYYINQWAWGISNTSWYAWDINVAPRIFLSQSNYINPTAAGIAYRETGEWLKGATMTGREKQSDGTHIVTIERPGGYVGKIVWKINGSKTFTIPGSWNTTNIRTLAGGSQSPSSSVSIGYAPKLLEGTKSASSLPKVTGTVNVPATSSYRVWSRVKISDSVSDSFTLKIGSSSYLVGDSGALNANQWVWVDFQNGATTNKLDVSLSAGSRSFELIENEPGVKIDRVILTTDKNCIPTGTGDNCANPPDTTPPSVSISSPTSGSTVSGQVHILADANDDTGVQKVEFYIDGVLARTENSSPFEYFWDSNGVADGAHTIYAKAFDTAGNTTVSSSITITVQNSSGGGTNFLDEDINEDGIVNLLDFSLLASNFGRTGNNLGRVDINSDGKVNLLDFSLLASKFGQSSS